MTKARTFSPIDEMPSPENRRRNYLPNLPSFAPWQNSPSWSERAVLYQPLIAIWRGFTASTLGRRTVKIPFLHSASIRDASIDSWIVNER